MGTACVTPFDLSDAFKRHGTGWTVTSNRHAPRERLPEGSASLRVITATNGILRVGSMGGASGEHYPVTFGTLLGQTCSFHTGMVRGTPHPHKKGPAMADKTPPTHTTE